MKAPCVRYLQAHNERASRQKKSDESERETGGNARKGKSVGERGRGRAGARENREETEMVVLENIYSESD